jgi:hypothetical protein
MGHLSTFITMPCQNRNGNHEHQDGFDQQHEGVQHHPYHKVSLAITCVTLRLDTPGGRSEIRRDRCIQHTGIIIRIDLLEPAIDAPEFIKHCGHPIGCPEVEDRGDILPFHDVLLDVRPAHNGE